MHGNRAGGRAQELGGSCTCPRVLHAEVSTFHRWGCCLQYHLLANAFGPTADGAASTHSKNFGLLGLLRDAVPAWLGIC